MTSVTLPADARPTLLRRCLVSAGLCLFFMVFYCGSQQVAARRAHVPSFHFGWERHVPFVAAMVVPYLSVDVFFVAVPLLMRTRRELAVLSTRVMVAIGVGAVCFVVVPLRFAFDRPAGPGLLGVVWDRFHQADLPLNELPSLHIATLVIIAPPFLRATRGAVRGTLAVWFGLIGVSPLLVYQHHAADLLAGLGLGLLCLTLIGDERREPFERNGRTGGYYLAGGLAMTVACGWLGRSAWPLWWPTASVLAVAVVYLAVGPAAYGKRDGRLSWAARTLFWPTLAGQRASRRWYARRSRAWDAVTDQLWVGRQLTAREADELVAAGARAVVDLTCEFTEPAALRSVAYLHVPTLDLTAPTVAQLDRAVAFAVQQMAAGRVVYVHCKAGYSRTAVVAAALLLATGRAASADDAVAMVRAARPGLVVRPEARRAIAAFAGRRSPAAPPRVAPIGRPAAEPLGSVGPR